MDEQDLNRQENYNTNEGSVTPETTYGNAGTVNQEPTYDNAGTVPPGSVYENTGSAANGSAYSNPGPSSQGNAYPNSAPYGNAGNTGYTTPQWSSGTQGNPSFAGGNPYYEKFRSIDNGAAEKEARRAAKREARRLAKAGKKSGFGLTLVKCASIALVFGLVSGSAFSGIVYFSGATGKLLEKTETVTETAPAKTTVDTEDTTRKTQADAKVVYTNVTGLEDVSSIVKETMPAIVSITNLATKSTQWFGQIYTEDVEYAGSGIIVSSDDDYLYIATNNHVVSGAKTITVTFADDTTAVAEVKGTSPSNDLAVVSVAISELADGTLNNIKVATINSSGDTLVGEAAIAIGNALGYGQSVTTGVISAIGREVTIQDDESGTYYTSKLIQTDAAINPGNSGGALLNAQGEVIGINSSKYSDTSVEGMGFAIPMTQAVPIINNLIERNLVDETEAAYIGISGVDVDAKTAETYGMPTGIYITKIYEGSPAASSELMVGDFLVAFEDTKIGSMEELQDTLKYFPAGTEVTLTVKRANRGVYEDVKVKVVLGKKAEVNVRN